MKKWLITLLCLVFCAVAGVGTVNFAVDPLMQYRVLNPKITAVAYDYDYINPGVAKNCEYSSVLVGTSLAENTDMDAYEKLFGCKMIKLIFPGGTPLNLNKVLSIAFDTHEVKRVIWCVDDALYFNSADETAHSLPEYLYDNNKLNDLGYLLNLSVFYNYTFKDVLNSARGQVTPPLLRGDVWGKTSHYGREQVLSGFDDSEVTENRGEDYYIKNVTSNLNKNIIPLIKANPKTQFLFFFPPKNVRYWKSALNLGVFDAKVYSTQYVIKELLEYSNVKVYFYQNDMELTTDYSIYTDSIHFNNSINTLLGEMMSAGTGEVTKANCSKVMSEFSTVIKAIDYSKYID